MLNSFLKKSPPPLGQRRIGGVGRLSSLGVALALCAYLEPPARADVAGTFKEAWTCAKSVPGSVQAMGQDLIAKGEAVASMSTSAGACVAQSGAQLETLGFVTATLGTIKLTNPELLPDGECKKRIHAQLARPFVLGISALVPEASVKAQLMKQANSDQAADVLWNTLASAPPPFGTIPSELDCGCEMIDGAVTLADVSVVSQVIRNTSQACAGMLDQAGLGFLNNWGSTVIGWIGNTFHKLSSWAQGIQGIHDPQPDPIAYQGLYGAYVPSIAAGLAGSPPNTSPYSIQFDSSHGGWSDPGPFDHPNTWAKLDDHCAHYYKSHKFPDENVKKCGLFKSHAAAEAVQEGNRLRLRGATITVFKMKLYGLLEKEWLWRLPPCKLFGNILDPTVSTNDPDDGNRCDLSGVMALDLWKLGSCTQDKDRPWDYKASPGGIYERVWPAVVATNYNADLAHTAVLAGADAGLRSTTLASWNDPIARGNVRRRWLPKWMPRPPFRGPYGCGAGVIGAACTAQVEKGFDAACHLLIRDAFVRGLNILDSAFKFGKAKADCRQFLGAIVTNADELDAAGNNAVTAKSSFCPDPAKDRAKAAECTAHLRRIWEDCAKHYVGLVLDLQQPPLAHTRTCFDSRVLIEMPVSAEIKVPNKPIVAPNKSIFKLAP